MSLNVTNGIDEGLVHKQRLSLDVARWLLTVFGCLAVGVLLGVAVGVVAWRCAYGDVLGDLLGS